VLLNAAVVPGPPALVPELMGSAAHELDDLREAVDRAVCQVLSALTALTAPSPGSSVSDGDRAAGAVAPADASSLHAPAQASASTSVQLVVVGAGPPGEFDASGPVSFSSFGRDVTIPALLPDKSGDRELPTPIMVARYLASRDLAAHPEHAPLWETARWITTSGRDAHALGATLGSPSSRIGLILMADGAACHGPKAPRAQDPRAEPYDEAVCAALASGQPDRLGQIDPGLGDELGATGAALWPALVAAAGVDEAQIAEVLWTGAPYGVGWTVASWRRPCR
jgi:hypothetical protein